VAIPRTFLPALIEALVASNPTRIDHPRHELALEKTTRFVEGQIAALPVVLRTGLTAGLAVFRGHVAARFLMVFCRLPLDRRIKAVDLWASGSFAQGRQLFRPLRSLALLAYHEALHGGHGGDGAPSVPTVSSVPSVPSLRAGVLVIGSGAGGAVTALELTRCGHQVLLVEEGDPPGEPPPDAGATSTMARLYRHRGMTPILGHVPIAYVEGRCLGGSTEINSGFWHRPPVEAVLRWRAQYDLAGAGPDELRPHCEWAEQMLDVDVQKGQWPPSTEAFSRGARAMDWATQEVPRTAARARASSGAAGVRPGPGMSRSLIPKAIAAGTTLLTGCRVETLDISANRVKAAIVRRRRPDGSSDRIRIEADHVFVCAGPTETPALLRRAGVRRHVGDSLRIHPMLKLAARFSETMGSGPADLPLLQVKEFWPDIVLGGSFFSSGHLAVVLADNWAHVGDRMHSLEQMASYYVGVRGTGRGQVRPSRLDPGRTVIRYELSDQDMWNLSRGLARLAAMLLEGGALEVLPAVHGLAAIRSDVEAVRWLDDRLSGGACSLTTVHAFSTCPIGERRDRCAADSFGRLHGFDNLYINDASMIPDSPGVNPQGTIMAFARRNALHFCDEHPAR
jgi:choline dehydrogenase-like flavoprotein